MNPFVRIVVLALTFVVLQLVSLALADDAAGPAGYWEGAIRVPQGELPVALELVAGEDGWSGDLDIPAQGVRDQALTELSVEGARVSFRIPEFPGGPMFVVTLSEDGGSMTGTMSQGGQELPVTLARAEAPPKQSDEELYGDYVKAGAPGEGLAGTWRGILAAGPAKLRLVLHVSEAGDGSLVATMDSVDQGATGIGIDDVVLEDDGSVSFALLALNAAYDGTLAEDGSEIVGQWQQGGQSVPLTFKRAGEGE